MSLGEKNELIESFSLKIAHICFTSKFVDKKVQGLAMILDILKKIKFQEYKHLKEE